MRLTRITEYGPGGFDPAKPNSNVIRDEEVSVEETPEAAGQRDTETKLRTARGAIAAHITTLQAIRDGSGTPSRAEIRDVARVLQDVLQAQRLLVSAALRDYAAPT